MLARKRDLIGRRIVAVDFRRWHEAGRGWLHDPVFILDNGRRVWFVTEESDTGDYGHSVCITEAAPRPARRQAPASSGPRGSAPGSSAAPALDSLARGAADVLRESRQAPRRLHLVKGGKSGR